MLYNVVLVSTIYQHESDIDICMSPPFWTSFPPPTPFHPLGCYRALAVSSPDHMAIFTGYLTLHMVLHMLWSSFSRVIWGAVSQTAGLTLLKIKLNFQLNTVHFFKQTLFKFLICFNFFNLHKKYYKGITTIMIIFRWVHWGTDR